MLEFNFNKHLKEIETLKDQIENKTVEQTKSLAPALCKQLDHLEASLSRSQSKDRKFAAKLLNQLDSDVTKANLDVDDSSKIHKRIDDLQAAILQKSAEKLAPAIPSRLAIFLDSDHNGAFAGNVTLCLRDKIPFIISASFLNYNDMKDQSQINYIRGAIKTNLKQGWEVFQQVDEKYGDQFLICLPKGIKPEDLDLVPRPESGSKLLPITVEDAMSGTHDVYRFEALGPLLGGKATHEKLVALHGHGSAGEVMGLKTTQVNDLMGILKHQRCRAVGISSCYSGGKSTLSMLPEPGTLAPPAFPLIVQSIGDYSTLSGQADQEIKPFFDELESVMRQSGGETTSAFRRAIRKAEKTTKNTVNEMQVYFPQDQTAVQGFRALSESDTSFNLTLVKLRGAQLAAKKSETPTTTASISIENMKHLTINPIFVDAKLAIKGTIPAFLSTIPGQAHHYIKEVDMGHAPFSEFLKSQNDFYTNVDLSVDKAFFIDRLVCADGTVEKVVMVCSENKNLKIYFSKNGEFFEANEQIKPITALHYGVETSLIYSITEPTSRAVDLSTGGQQSRDVMQESWVDHPFEGKLASCNPAMLSAMTEIEAATMLESFNTSEEKVQFIYHLINQGRMELVEKLTLKGLVAPDMVFSSGSSLLHLAIEEKSIFLLDYLLAQPIDINTQNARGKTALHLAFSAKNRPFVEKLLNHPEIDVNALDNDGLPILYMAPWVPECQELLLRKGAEPNKLILKQKQQTIITRYCSWVNPPIEAIEKLLLAGADPNLGKPTGIEVACQSGKSKLMSLLLKYGAKPFEANADGHIPFTEILKKAPRSQILELLTLTDGQEGLTNNLENFILFLEIAQNRGDVVIQKSLLERMNRVSVSTSEYIGLIETKRFLVCTYLLNGNIDPLARDPSGKFLIERLVTAKSFQYSQDSIENLFKWDKFNPNQLSSKGDKLFCNEDWIEAYGKQLLDLGIKIDEKQREDDYLMKIIFAEPETLQSFLVNHSPLKPDEIKMAFNRQLRSVVDTKFAQSFKPVLESVNRGLLDWSLDLGSGKTLSDLVLQQVVQHKPIEELAEDEVKSSRPLVNYSTDEINEGITKIVAFCLERGADPNWPENLGNDGASKSIIEIAIRDRNKPLIDLLLKYGLKDETFAKGVEAVKESQDLVDWVKSQGYSSTEQ